MYKVALAEVQVCTTANANLRRCESSLALRQLQTCTSHSPWGRHKRRFCVNCRALPRQFSVSPEGNGNVGIPSGCQSVYQQCQEGRAIASMGLRQCKLALARTQGCTLHCARLRSSKYKFALQRMQTCAAADPAVRYANCKLAHRIVHGDGTNGGFASLAAAAQLALGVRHFVPKRKFRTAFANTVRNLILL